MSPSRNRLAIVLASRRDALGLAIDAASYRLEELQNEARHYRRWDVPEKLRTKIALAKRDLAEAEQTFREFNERARRSLQWVQAADVEVKSRRSPRP